MKKKTVQDLKNKIEAIKKCKLSESYRQKNLGKQNLGKNIDSCITHRMQEMEFKMSDIEDTI